MPRETVILTETEISVLEGLKDYFDTLAVSSTIRRSVSSGYPMLRNTEEETGIISNGRRLEIPSHK